MEKLVLYCKSYSKDFARLVNLVSSVEEYNKDNIRFYVSVPKEDVSEFKQIEGITVICDDDIYQSNKPGWVQQ